jgi:ribosomal protein L16 Arg81 hydroxylase
MSSSAALMPGAGSSLESLIAPMSRQEFLHRYWGQSFVHIPGFKGRFASLAPWSQLNRILEEHRLKPPRLTLVHKGQEISPTKYLRLAQGENPILKVAEFTNLLAGGATLILNEFDEIYRPVTELAIILERTFRIHIHVNLYAGWRTDNGFLVHYDDHDTFILQVAGTKHWRVYNPTRLHPLAQGKDAEPAEKPTEAPIWDGILENGGFLYIPRGWWHVAFPLDEPTLHLTFSLVNPRGLDLLSWFVGQLKNSKEARMDLPHLASRAEQLSYIEELRRQMLVAWTSDLLDRFMASSDSRVLPRPCVQLPESATPEGLTIRENTQIRLTAPRRLNLPETKDGEGIAKFNCQGRAWKCSKHVLPALHVLNDGTAHSLQELMTHASDPGSAFAIHSFLQALVLQGVVTTTDDPESRI